MSKKLLLRKIREMIHRERTSTKNRGDLASWSVLWELEQWVKRMAPVLVLVVLWGCPKPNPTPTPTPSPTPTPTPPPTTCECVVPPDDDKGWHGTTVAVPYNEHFIQKARDVVGDRCGTTPEDTLKLLAEAMKGQNICAAQWADALLVVRPDGKWEQWHVVRYDTGCWASLSGAYVAAWTNTNARSCQ